ncbi:MAG: rod shape-determining protein RodA [Crocinitomicaceae bacterium]|nr:rod shape-determining protein RodA [Crocinitomicaceae bacterium]MDG1777154.1 rod shape-determining protein RodA [Crocinitomicaceae bacterium]
MRQNQSLTGSIDWPLVLVYVLLLTMGVSTVYSVAYTPEHPSIFDFSQKYGKQMMWIGVSLFLGCCVFLINSDIYRKFALPIYLSVIALLVVVLFMPPVNGARAWLGIGSMGIQPAEFAKIGTAIILARSLSSMNLNQQSVKTVVIANAIILLPMALILLQPDAGTFVVFTSFLFVLYREGLSYDPIIRPLLRLIPIRALHFKQTWIGSHFIPILFVVIFLSITTLLISNETITLRMFPGEEIPGYWGMLFFLALFCLAAYFCMRFVFSKRDRKRALFIAIIGFFLAAVLTSIVNYSFQKLAGHQKERIELVLGLRHDPDGDDYNRNRAMAAVGSGGMFGKGYQNAIVSSLKTNHVPESETDFIFCPYAEEWGFMGTFVLVGLYLFMILRIVFIAERQKSSFNRIYAYAVAMILFYHFTINIGMSIEFAPVIGIPLPFFSYGGSSMMSFSIMMFVLLKLDSQRGDVLN